MEHEKHSIAGSYQFFLSYCKVFNEFTHYLADNQHYLLTLIVNNQHVNLFLRIDYLIKKFPTRKNELLENLLRRRYIGITLNKDVIYNAYINRNKAGNEHVYNYVLRNLSLKQNFNPFNIFAVVEFLKTIALNPVITHEKFHSDAINIIVMLISSFPNPSYSLVLKNRFDQKFRLLGVYHDLVLKSLLEALRILNRNPT